MQEPRYELELLIREVIDKTNDGKIDWQRPNATTYIFERNISKGLMRTSLQKVRIPNKNIDRFIFRVTNVGREDIISIDTLGQNEFYDLLEILFQSIDKRLNEKVISTLKELFNNL